MSALDELLSPRTRDEFLSEFLGNRCLHIPGDPQKFRHLLTWPALNRLLEEHDTIKNIALWKDGKRLDSSAYTRGTSLSAPDLTELIRDGSTLLINGMDQLHQPIARLAQRLGRDLQTTVGVNMYSAWRSNHGFGIHWDDHDVFILQIHGRKQWQIFGQAPLRYPLTSGEYPMRGNDMKLEAPIWEEYLNPGDFLYIPRGWWHFARPCDEPVVHLTVGMCWPKGVDFVKWLSRTLEQQECLRMDIPIDADGQIRYMSAVQEAVTGVISDPGLMSRFVFETNSKASPRRWFGLPVIAMSDVLPESDMSHIELAVPLGLEIRQRTDEGELDVAFNDKTFTFDESTLPLFRHLDQGGNMTLREFYLKWEGDFDRDELKEFLSALAKTGIILVQEPAQV